MTFSGEFSVYLRDYLGLKDDAVERIELLKMANLPQKYKAQREFFADDRLDDVTIAIVPDDLWVKGAQPSESSAEKQLILIKQSYFESHDEIAWLCHELAHCIYFFNSESAEEYLGKMVEYPDNPVEQYAFSKQFQFLKKQGKTREAVLVMLKKFYDKKDFAYFNKLLDGVYG